MNPLALVILKTCDPFNAKRALMEVRCAQICLALPEGGIGVGPMGCAAGEGRQWGTVQVVLLVWGLFSFFKEL